MTATDGNHGRGVAWAAEQLGLRAVVYMPKGSSPVRAQNIRRHGAECTITELNYDDTVRLAAKTAREQGWVLPRIPPGRGYEQIPTWIMQGYMTLAVEIWQQLAKAERRCRRICFYKPGSGRLPVASWDISIEKMQQQAPTIIIVEPHKANCLFLLGNH
ncbi:pyridoxal-phosphate dependent enzyme [Klebsiella pneumoniae subsp. pneumoniae]|nr:pyridoxal-phosphate dependent enzyme [Klebsiella pneumoniae subsp. pneumoniae]